MPPRRKRALLLYGGWEGHDPKTFADFAQQQLLSDFDVTLSSDLEMLRHETLSQFDLLLPIWTFGEITKTQESGLLQACQEGLGVVAWHGSTSAFLESRAHKFLLGGQFVAHIGGESVIYDVNFTGSDPLVCGLEDLTVCSEQYYLLVDPAIEVLATTRINGDNLSWLSGLEMPLAWKRAWGQERSSIAPLDTQYRCSNNARSKHCSAGPFIGQPANSQLDYQRVR